jgi:hypothetical protein
MNAYKLLATAVLIACATPGLAFATCSHSTDITNDSNVTMRIVELKSSSSPPVWKSQWVGFLAIAPNATETIEWTSDLDCEDGAGVENQWDVKLYRSIGKVHYCDNLSPSEPISINAPDLCFH